jgi:hypothetical protein
VLAFRANPAFRQSVIVTEILPLDQMGNYHLGTTPTSPARGRGTGSITVTWGTGLLPFTYTVTAPSKDIDGDNRPTVVGTSRRYDAGSDQMVP